MTDKNHTKFEEKELRFRQTLSALPDGVVLLRKDLVIQWMNRIAERDLSLDPEKDVGKKLTDVFTNPEFIQHIQSERWKARQLIDLPDGRVLEVRVISAGKKYTVVVTRDITESKRIDDFRRDFVGNVSHELRTPLTVIQGFLELATENPNLNEEDRLHWEMMLEQAERMRALVDDLLALSRLEQDAAPASRELIDVDEILEEAVAEGVRRGGPDAQVSALPLADGGEGTVDAVAACGGEVVACEVAGPLGDCVSARMLVDGEYESAVIEMAEAAGIGYSPCTEPAALAATTYGVGELMLRAVRAGAKTIYIGLGGSATNDGGAGMLQALGARVVDDQGCDVAPGLAGLEQVASIDLAPALRALNSARIVVLSDVENPLVGRRGALAVFGGQKGLPTDDVEALGRYDSWMVGYGRLLDAAITGVRAQGLLRVPEGVRTFGSVLGVPGAGAAGGLGAALLALGAELRSGVETVLDLIGFDERVRDVDLVITGEGNMDEQSAAGKASVGVARRANRYGKPVVAVVGGRADNLNAVYEQGIDLVLPICRKPMPLDQALNPQEATTNLIFAGESAAQAYDLARL